jgi:argininosuccinate lyase
MAGDVGAKLHTGRSRNDQVATDLRLYTAARCSSVAGQVLALQGVLLAAGRGGRDAYLPGYTHLQRAQPVLLAHHLLAHGWALARDVDRLFDTVARLDVSPLGAGALAGSSLPLDPDGVAEDLGFRAGSRTPSTRSPTATSSPRRSSTWRCSGSTCRGWARSS